MGVRSILNMIDHLDDPSSNPKAKKRKNGKPNKFKKKTKPNE